MNAIELPLSRTPDKTRDEFIEILRTLAHKLSQPLTCLRGSVEVALLGEIRESECRDVLEQSLEESHRMAETLELLRDVLETESADPEETIQTISWQQCLEESLREIAFLDHNCHLQISCEVMEEAWVNANGQALDSATRQLLGWVIKRCRGKKTARIVLSVEDQVACLSICESSVGCNTTLADEINAIHISAATLEPRDPEWWIIRRTIERQGGWVKISHLQGTSNRYLFYLPLAFSEAAQHT